MATINSINRSGGSLTVDPGVSGDSFIQFDINTTGEFRIGVDDTDGDAFVISQGSALGTNNTFRMSADGERTLPLQSAFLAYNSANDDNVTGNGTSFTVIYDTEIYDQNGDFNGTTTFTAPVTGRYEIGTVVRVKGLTASHTDLQCFFISSNRAYRGTRNNVGPLRNVDDNSNVACTYTIADMDAADTVYFQIFIANGTKVVDVVGSSVPYTRFWGHLVC